jgi:hypothetical protein
LVILGGRCRLASGPDANDGRENAMLHALRSRLTYANVMATIAVFLALGGGAYALSGIPDRGGIYHGCVATSGALRVVTNASSCLKAKTVKRGTRRVRIPGESAITWNQQGRPGLQGGPGVQGVQGVQGLVGPTAGFASTANGTPPNSPANGNWDTVNFTTPTSGKLFIAAQAHATTTCFTAIGCGESWGVYIDGAPIPGTLRFIQAAPSGSASDYLTIYGVTDTVSAGPHTLRLQNKSNSGSPAASMTGTAQIGAVLLGG